MTWGLHRGFTGQVSVKGLHPAHCALQHTQVHPPALAFVTPSFIPSSSGIFPRHPDSSFLLASNICACPLPQAFDILCSSLLTASILWASGSLFLALTHLCIPVSYFGIQPVPLPAAPLGRDHPAIAAKIYLAIKMDDLFSIILSFSVSGSLN